MDIGRLGSVGGQGRGTTLTSARQEGQWAEPGSVTLGFDEGRGGTPEEQANSNKEVSTDQGAEE